MKSPVAVALIVVGGILILAPAISDHFCRAQIATIMTGSNMANVSLHPDPMGDGYRFGCWLAGVIMIALAAFGSRNSKQP